LWVNPDWRERIGDCELSSSRAAREDETALIGPATLLHI
jgi:hypothetical protein